ncbi:putative anion exchange protein [Schistosoma mansoni]|uniref:putative anion exchange protein n=1 Tax=Schistosoma mansoni TaxID=6183 RepID=UPI00022DCA81|nr:putative anion exchange protein [Schistosoma mansoni]|eukprot:XP_018654942.1 putative anion exchange protein [Schistosoma mansoni]
MQSNGLHNLGKYFVGDQLPIPLKNGLIPTRISVQDIQQEIVCRGALKLTLKDFASEVRANLDIDMFIKEATLLLDLDGSTLEDIISSMLEAIFDNRPIVDTATSTTTNTTANMTPSSPSSPDDTDSNQWSRTSATTTSGFGPKVNFSITGNSDKTNLSKLDIENMKLEAKNSLMMQINYQGYTYQRLAKTIKGVSLTDDDCLSTDQSWICAMCSLRSIHKRYLALARLNNPVNFGRSSEGTYLIVLIITPTKEKGTKSEIEVGRTFGTILSDPIFRQELLFATDEKEVKLLLWDRAQQLAAQQSTDRRRSSQYLDIRNQTFNLSSQSMIGKGIYLDLKRKIPYYWSDITEGTFMYLTLKQVSTTLIYTDNIFITPRARLGVNVTRVIMGQTIGGLCYGVFGGQPLLVLLSTAPLALYIKSKSTEEIFAMFVSMAFLYDAGNDLYSTFQENYHCKLSTNYSLISNETLNIQGFDINFIHSNYSFNFALPIAVVSMSLVGSLIFGDIKLKPFEVEPSDFMLNKAPLNLLSWPAVLGSIGIAIPLSLLFYMEQNIASAILNSPSNKLRKGPSNHWDLFVIALINIILSIFCLPWVHAALPHTPLHVKALADMEEHVDGGHHIRQTIIRVRETRLTLFISHVLIGLSLAMIPYPLIYIPPPVLNGLFIYMAITALQGNQMFERILLFITEQSAYPPSHYIRRVPQRKLHLFTFFQLIQLGFLCAFGFAPSPYVKLIFPVILVVQIVLRHTLIPKAIDSKYLEALDRHF